MENSLTVALARQGVLTRQMDVISTNLANMTTAGYKAETIVFTEFLEQSPTGEVLSLVHDVSVHRDLSEGSMTGTNSPLDVAIHGSGYFAIETADGERYSRHGAFQLDADGQIVTTQGNPVLGAGGGPIVVPPGAGSIAITRDGTVSADANEIGRFRVVDFADPQALHKSGNGLYEARDQAPLPAPGAEILQGMIESSNVHGVVEMTRMINVVREYQAAARLGQTEHERILKAIEAIAGQA